MEKDSGERRSDPGRRSNKPLANRAETDDTFVFSRKPGAAYQWPSLQKLAGFLDLGTLGVTEGHEQRGRLDR